MDSRNDTLAGGLPHSDIHGSKPARGSPWLFAACHVLHRLLVPRHPPNALLSLKTYPQTQSPGITMHRNHPQWQVSVPSRQLSETNETKDQHLCPRAIRTRIILLSITGLAPVMRTTHASEHIAAVTGGPI